MSSIARRAAPPTRLPWLLLCLTIGIGVADGLYKNALAAWPAIFWTHDVTVKIVLPSLCMYSLRYWLFIRPRDYGLGAIRLADFLVLSLLCSLVLSAVYFAALKIAQANFPGSGVFVGFASMLPAGASRLPGVLYLAASAACFEDVIYIGLIGYIFRRALPGEDYAVAFIFTASVTFAVTHWETGVANTIATGILNAVACMLFLRIRTLWPLIAGHFVIDLVTFW